MGHLDLEKMSSTQSPVTKIGDIVNIFKDAECDDADHTGQAYEDILTILFILAWVQVVPSVLAIIQYFSSFFAKKRRIICCNEKWKKAKIEADEMTMDGTQVEGHPPSYKKRKRPKGRMCCVTFLRNASVFLNYLIVISAFVAGIMVIYVYLNENDRQIENIQNTFYTLRAASVIHLILAILGIFYLIFMPVVMYYSPLPMRGIAVVIFNARINLQLLIYFLSILWFIIFFVSAYLEFFYTWDNCGDALF